LRRCRPVIGVTGPAEGGTAAWLMASLAIGRAGGVPRRIAPTRRVRPDRLKRKLKGLIIGGGADVHPELYYDHHTDLGDVLRATVEQARAPTSRASSKLWAPAILLMRYALRARHPSTTFDRERDVLELDMLDFAVAHGLPVLGICRGAQLLNVFLGGTLFPEIRDFYTEEPLRTVLPRKTVALEPDSRLSSIVRSTTFRVNALHHQSVRTLGRGLRAVARDQAGVVQAIEDPDQPFRIGVQWHPEYIPQHDRQLALFKALVRAARGR
jgi:putative glutamine amidotransferase